jgi:hypothetical protein
VRPGNSWDLRSYRQQPGESLRDYIRRFSKQRTELPNVTELPDMKRHADNFEPAEMVKSVPLNPSNDASKQIRIGSELDPK